jgi:hypothetical protein
MSNAIAMRDPAHLNGGLHRLGTIVDQWQDVVVDVDHNRSIPSLAKSCSNCSRLHRCLPGKGYRSSSREFWHLG